MPSEPTSPIGKFILYQTEDGQTRIECRFEAETLWLSQALMAELFNRDTRTINEHLKSIYDEGELVPGATIRKFRIVRQSCRMGKAQRAHQGLFELIFDGHVAGPLLIQHHDSTTCVVGLGWQAYPSAPLPILHCWKSRPINPQGTA